jgi:hypothetical protein
MDPGIERSKQTDYIKTRVAHKSLIDFAIRFLDSLKNQATQNKVFPSLLVAKFRVIFISERQLKIAGAN